MELWTTGAIDYIILKMGKYQGSSYLYQKYKPIYDLSEEDLKLEGKTKVGEYIGLTNVSDIYVNKNDIFKHSIVLYSKVTKIAIYFTPCEKAFLGDKIFEAFRLNKIMEWE